MIRRVLIILGSLLAGLIALTLLAVFVLPKTGPGRGLIDSLTRPRIAAVVEQQLGSDIDYSRLRGALPGELILEDITLEQEGAPWLTADRVTLRWSPLALISGDIEVKELLGETVTVYRRPTLPEREPEEEVEDDGPFSLPSIRVDRFALINLSLREELLGERYDLTLESSFDGQGQNIAAIVDLATTSGSDEIDLDVNFTGDALTLSLDADSAADGLLTTLASAEEPVSLTLTGEGPLAEWAGTLNAALGAYGTVNGEIGGNLETFAGAQAAITVAPGRLIPENVRSLSGETLELNAETMRDGDQITVDLAQLAGRFGSLTGQIVLPGGNAERIQADVTGTITEVVANEFGAGEIAGPIALTADVTRGETLTADASFTSKLGEISLTDGASGDGELFAGLIRFNLNTVPIEQDRLTPILKDGGVGSVELRVSEDMKITVRELDAVFGRLQPMQLRLKGQADYAVESGTFAADLTADAGRDAAALLIGTDTFAGALTAEIEGQGTTKNASVKITAALPAGVLGGQNFAAGQLKGDLSGLPTSPRGTLSLTARDSSYRGEVALASTSDVLDISQLTFTASDLEINGQGQYRPATGRATGAFSLNAPRPTLLITGQTIDGSLTAEVDYNPEAGQILATVQADELAVDGVAVEEATLTANGPLRDMAFSLRGRNIQAPSVYLARLETEGTVDAASETRIVVLSSLLAAVNEDTEANRITLLNPARVEIGDGVTVSPVRVDWLNNGTLSLSGRYASERWIADVNAEQLEIPGFVAPLTVSVDLDTAQSPIAQFNGSASVSPEDSDDTYALAATGTWDGETVSVDARFTPEGGDDILTADIGWPVSLTRTGGRLGVALPDAAVQGVIRLDGDIEPIYAIAPSVPPYLTGALNGVLQLEGTAKSPGVNGDIRLSDGRFEETAIGVTLTNLEGRADFQYAGQTAMAQITLTGAGARGGENAVNVTGEVRRTAESSSVDIAVNLDEAQIVSGPQLTARTSADLSLQGSLEAMTLSGDVNITEVNASIAELPAGGGFKSYTPVNVVRVDGPEVPDPSLRQAEQTAEGSTQIALDVTVRANNRIYIRGRGLDSEWQTNLAVSGYASDPIISGTVQSRKGTFDFAGREFDLQTGRILFVRGTSPAKASMEVRAALETDDATAFVNVGGTVSDPSITVTSNPSLPQEDVMALVLFGKQPTELTALESLQIANAVRTLAGVGPTFGGGAGGGIQGTLGLDALSFGVDSATGEGVVSVGKYVADNIYVSAKQSAQGSASEIIVTYEFSDNVTIESTLQPNGAQTVSANYKKDY